MTEPITSAPAVTMDADIWRAWIDDLRSGQHQQVRGVLNDGKGGFCCLGRLCDLAIQRGRGCWTGDSRDGVYYQDPDTANKQKFDEDGNPIAPWGDYEVISGFIQDFAGFQAQSPSAISGTGLGPSVEYHGERLFLAELNDGNAKTGREPLTFAEIADLIEAQITPIPSTAPAHD